MAVAQDPLACPSVPSSGGYSVSMASSIDFLDCTMSPLRSELLPARLYVGNHPYAQNNLQFIGFTPSPIGSLAWFSSTTGTESHWVTYIPTGREFPDVLMLSVDAPSAPSLEQLGSVAGVVVRHSPNISIQRTRYARR
jgi:hypothetical protein